MSARSPQPGAGLTGYAAEHAVTPGATVELMAAGPPGDADARVVRLVHGDPNPAGPRVIEHETDWLPSGPVAIEEREVPLGSYVQVDDVELLGGGFTLALWFKPTLLRGGWHALATQWAPGEIAAGLFLAGDGILTGAVSRDGRHTEWITAKEFALPPSWQFVALAFDPDGELVLHHGSPPAAVRRRIAPGALAGSTAPFLLGACWDPQGSGRPWGHLNGRIGHPMVFSGALADGALAAVAAGADPGECGELRARWDLALAVGTDRVVDVSGNERHGRAVNAPGRAVTGPRFTGVPMTLFGDGDQDYGAVHLHDDDLDDTGWPATVRVPVPRDARSGIYALRLERPADSLVLPFVVRPARPTQSLALLVPTLTWRAYGSNSQPWSWTEDAVLDQGVCLYNRHSDGSPVYYASSRRPTRGGNPAAGFQNWGAHNLTADLYLVEWLERQGFEYDTFADEHLHAAGAELLSAARCLVLGSHPEYCTAEMLDALEAYVAGGGRVVYLGGNGLFWVTSIDSERPHLIEVRKQRSIWPDDFPNPVAEVGDGERRHSTDAQLGGTWRGRGRPPSALLGVEYVADVFEEAAGRWWFEPGPDAGDARVAWAFDGVGERFGGRGLNLGSAIGFELDGVPEGAAGAGDFLLARCAHPAFEPAPYAHGRAASDVVLRVQPGGGAVFSAGSVTWTGSLSLDRGIARMTENVLRRFLDTAPGEPIA